MAKWFGKDITIAGLRNIVGGELKEQAVECMANETERS